MSGNSLSSVIGTALTRKRVPPYVSGSTRDLAKQLGMPFPVSIRELGDVLDGLPPASRTIDSGPLTANYVHGSAFLYLQSDGGVSWGGRVHESGAVGDHFRMAIALLDVTDPAGHVLVFNHEDTVAGQLDIGFSEKNWTDSGVNQLIADNWEKVRTSRVRFILHASTDALQAIETAFSIVGIVAGIIVVGIFGGKQACPSGQWKCGWQLSGSNPNAPVAPGTPTESPEVGADYLCRCESP